MISLLSKICLQFTKNPTTQLFANNLHFSVALTWVSSYHKACKQLQTQTLLMKMDQAFHYRPFQCFYLGIIQNCQAFFNFISQNISFLHKVFPFKHSSLSKPNICLSFPSMHHTLKYPYHIPFPLTTSPFPNKQLEFIEFVDTQMNRH